LTFSIVYGIIRVEMTNIGEIRKECSKCKITKSISEFYWRKDNGAYRNECKLCCKRIHDGWRKDNLGYGKEQSKQWRDNNPVKAKAICKKYRDTHKDKRYEVCTNWRINNPSRANAIQKRSYTKRRSTPQGNIEHRVGIAIRRNLSIVKSGRKWESLVGYTVNDLSKHLESLFVGGMNWDRFLKGEIHIDHVIPQSAFHYSSPDDIDFKRCWSLSNLQPLWADDNIKKGAKLSKPFQPSLKFQKQNIETLDN